MSFVDLSRVKEFVFRAEAIEKVEAFFLQKAWVCTEAAVILGGYLDQPQRFIVDLVFVPEQSATQYDVRMHPDALKEISAKLPGMKRMFAVQVHTHPTYAFHSSVDNDDTTLQQHGSLSIVIPFFGLRGLRDTTGWAVFRRDGETWRGPLSQAEIERLLVLED
jgi:hypothetical protein